MLESVVVILAYGIILIICIAFARFLFRFIRWFAIDVLLRFFRPTSWRAHKEKKKKKMERKNAHTQTYSSNFQDFVDAMDYLEKDTSSINELTGLYIAKFKSFVMDYKKCEEIRARVERHGLKVEIQGPFHFEFRPFDGGIDDTKKYDEFLESSKAEGWELFPIENDVQMVGYGSSGVGWREGSISYWRLLDGRYASARTWS